MREEGGLRDDLVEFFLVKPPLIRSRRDAIRSLMWFGIRPAEFVAHKYRNDSMAERLNLFASTFLSINENRDKSNLAPCFFNGGDRANCRIPPSYNILKHDHGVPSLKVTFDQLGLPVTFGCLADNKRLPWGSSAIRKGVYGNRQSERISANSQTSNRINLDAPTGSFLLDKAMHDLPKPKPPLVAPAVPLELRRASRPIADAPPPSSFVREAFPEDFPAESPRLNRAAAAVIITLALAVILVALVLSFRREVGAALIRLGQALAGDQQSPSSPTQGQSSPVPSAPHTDPAPATSAVNSPSPSSSAQTLASTPPSQPSVSPGQFPSITAQSAQARPSAIQRIEDLPAPEDGGSGQKEFDQAKEILKGIHRQRDIQMAVALLWTGVRKGYVPAEVTLADLYARGDGVQRSCEQARVLLKAAVQKGSPEARRRLTQLKQEGCLGN